jgi:hypothetical protein
MNRLQLAQHGYETIARALATALDEPTSDRAESWLRDDVCPVFEELARSQIFRLLVRWSCDRLTTKANFQERRLVEAVDRALIDCAKQLLFVAVNEATERSHDEHTIRDRVSISGADFAVLELIAQRPWIALAFADEFFHPACELGLRKPDPAHTVAFRKRGELRVPLGDYVTRCMLARVDYWKCALERILNDVLCGRSGQPTYNQNLGARLFDAKATLDRSDQDLRAACCNGPDAGRREASIILTQVYAAYAPSPDLRWLGFPGSGSGKQGRIRSCVRRPGLMQVGECNETGVIEIVESRRASLCDPDVLRGIAASLGSVASFYNVPEDPDELIDWAMRRARLVLVDRAQRAVFWNESPVAEEQWDSHPTEWNLLWTLATNLGAPVDQSMLASPDLHPLKSRRHRLAKLLDDVLDLDGFIETKRRQGYALKLPDAEVILLRDAGDGKLVFEGRRSRTM